jgi:hypothetical protein
MRRGLRAPAAAGAFVACTDHRQPGIGPKAGRHSQMYSPDSPASMSIHEEATVFAEVPMMGCSTTLSCSTSTCRRRACSSGPARHRKSAVAVVFHFERPLGVVEWFFPPSWSDWLNAWESDPRDMARDFRRRKVHVSLAKPIYAS